MRKTFALAWFLVLAATAGAENRTWDFRNWSAATTANLAKDMAENNDTRWSDDEKGDGNRVDGNCYWWVPSGATELTTKTGGQETVIPETAGLTFNNERGRALALAVNYKTTSLGEYAGASYLWMGSKDQTFTIPKVKPGAKITIEVESHKPSEGRGVSLSVNGTAVAISEGSEKPKELTKCVWNLPADISSEQTVDVTVKNSNGCHIYSIEVNEDAPAVENAKIAYVFDSKYNGYNPDNDIIHMLLKTTDRFNNVTIDDLDVSTGLQNVDADSLTGYNVVVVSGAVAGDCAYAQTLKEAIAYVPVLNLNASMYKAWGYGEAVQTDETYVSVPEEARDNALFKPASESTPPYILEDGTMAMFQQGPTVGVTFPAGSYFAADDTLATVVGAVAMHIHNPNRNAYLYLPYPYENTSYQDNIVDILINAVQILNYSKAEIPQAAAPTFAEDYKQMNTDVTIKSATDGARIFYTTDGSVPTESSTPYSGAVNVTADGTIISAIAFADGYSASEVARDTVGVFETSQTPDVQVTQQEGKAVVTITNREEGATVYYNITGSGQPEESSVYTEPLTVTSHTEITAFAGEVSGKKRSELVKVNADVEGKEVRIDIVSHFDANKGEWAGGESKTKYYTEGKKNGYDFYVLTDSTVVKTPDGRDSTVYTAEPANKLTVWNPGSGWEAKSYGQGMLWENISVSKDIDNNNTDARYRGETAFDAGASNCSVTFGNVRKSNKTSNDPYSCSIQSTEAFQGPFDIVTFTGNASSSNLPRADIYVTNDTTDENSWERIDSVTFSKTQRYIKKSTLSYEGTDKVFVKLQADFSSIMVFDIYIMNAGEKSGDYTGIQSVGDGNGGDGTVVRTLLYNINGVQISKPSKGLNIIREYYDNGSVKTRKVIIR